MTDEPKTKRIEDDAAVFGASVSLLKMLTTMKATRALTSVQCIEVLFSALVATAVITGWDFETFKTWFLASGEVSYREFLKTVHPSEVKA